MTRIDDMIGRGRPLKDILAAITDADRAAPVGTSYFADARRIASTDEAACALAAAQMGAALSSAESLRRSR